MSALGIDAASTASGLSITYRGIGVIGAATAAGFGLVLPFIAIPAVGAGIVRLIVPGYVLAVGALLSTRHRPLYPGFCLAVFAFAPFLRRVADYQAGWVSFNPILLAPYAALLPTILALARQALLPRRHLGWAFAAIIACALYSTVLALVKGLIVPGLYEPLRWVLPMGLCAFIMECPPGEANATHRAVVGALIAVTLILAAYGMAQYASPPAWDVFWMQNLNITAGSFGQPEAFKIRPFSMLNSPGSLGLYLATSVLVLLGAGQVFAAVAGIAMLLLSAVRAGWLACFMGVAVMLLKASPRRRLMLLAAVGVGGLLAMSAGVGALQLRPEALESITDRLSSFSSLGTDDSAGERLQTYRAFFDRLADAPLGEGFGANESMAAAASKQNRVTLDSGILDVYLTFGVVGGTIWFVAMAALVLGAWRGIAAPWAAGSLTGYLGAILGLVIAFPLGTSTVGEVGTVGWVGFGFLLAAGAAGRGGDAVGGRSR